MPRLSLFAPTLLILSLAAAPGIAARWQQVGNAENSTDKIPITGAMPQDLNFAIRGECAQIFLTAHGVKFGTSSSARKLETDAIADMGQRSTVLIVCSLQ